MTDAALLPVQRRLAAILAADVAGYSRLMAADEERTLRRLQAHRRELIDPKVAEHKGRIVKTTGDGFLMEFASVVDAVRCAAEIQRVMRDRETETPDEAKIQFRIGVNLGDVIVEDDDIFGDGVNVAARLEGLAEPGGICISRVVRDQIRDKLPFAFDDMGEQSVKNIPRAVRTFALRPDVIAALPAVSVVHLPWAMRRRPVLLITAALLIVAVAAAGWWSWSGRFHRTDTTTASGQAAPPLSIVVLPFKNQSNDPEQEYVADGITNDLTADLSRIAGAFVIGRSTAFSYKGMPVDVKQVGQDLGVRYVLQGSFDREGDQIRIDVRLIDTATGAHVWTDQLNTGLGNLAGAQQAITARLANTLHRALVRDAARQIGTNPDVQDLILRGWAWRYGPPSKDAKQQAKQAFEQALELDPDSVDAKLGLADTLLTNPAGGSSSLIAEEDRAKAERLLMEVLDKDPSRADAHVNLGWIRLGQKRPAEARIEYEKALELDPNNRKAAQQLGWNLNFIGQFGAAKALAEKVIRLDPRASNLAYTYDMLGAAEAGLGHPDASIDAFAKSRALNPRTFMTHLALASGYALKGDLEKGRAALAESLKLKPEANSLEFLRRQGPCGATPACSEAREKGFFAGLRLLGFPEK